MTRGVHPPLRPWCIFSPVSDFPPYFRKIFRLSGKCQKFLPFPEKISHFHPPKFLTTFFLVINHKFRISPCFACFTAFPPLIRENLLFPPYFSKFPPCFPKIQQLFTYFTCIFSPLLWPWCIYASPNARTGRPCLWRIVKPRLIQWLLYESYVSCELKL